MSGVLQDMWNPHSRAAGSVSVGDQCGTLSAARVTVNGKFLAEGGKRWYLKGLTYGPFAGRETSSHLPEPAQLVSDLQQMRALGANAIRLYHLPPAALPDLALEYGLRLFIDVPWEKHRCFFEDWSSQRDALAEVRRAARQFGRHPGVFAISVANEIPHDVVRFYGAHRVARFIDQLLSEAKEHAPNCPVTYTNYPSTEFLFPTLADFYCANIYLERPEVLGRYLDRLQHVAGTLPLVLGECGVDSIRKTVEGQAHLLRRQLHEVFDRGLAGAFIFSFTDDWVTGGHAVEDWAFGITDRDRKPKPAATMVSDIWERVPRPALKRQARVSIVVCSYNGGATLAECLKSLMHLDYPDYEVILVDDGSTDDTPRIAARFPSVRYIQQVNRGLSAARNVGLQAATGEIVAYTDSDCVADPGWLLYLIGVMRDQNVDAAGGPNVPPPNDSWISRCVAVSPGGPSHVMLDDRHAEHIPGCNMAFVRHRLLEIGGFDAQFRQAGDDVDICWRLLDRGLTIGYSAAALVWHHRRSTVGAYLRQQKGYGRSEAMLHFKHPQRFNRFGSSRWVGVIYGDGAVGIPVAEPTVYHGRFGTYPYQIIYQQTRYSNWAYLTLLEWHLLAAVFLVLAIPWPKMSLVAAGMWGLTLAAAIRSSARASLPSRPPWWARPLICYLHLAQPIVRAWHRYRFRLVSKKVPESTLDASATYDAANKITSKTVSWSEDDVYWRSESARGREHLLDALVEHAKRQGWRGDYHAEWEAHDIELWADPFFNVRLLTATEELGWPRRFTRVRCRRRLTVASRLLMAGVTLIVLAGVLSRTMTAMIPGAIAGLTLFTALMISRSRCRKGVVRLVAASGLAAGLEPVRATRSGSILPGEGNRKKEPVPVDSIATSGGPQGFPADAAPRADRAVR